jgi:hypothetical protein
MICLTRISHKLFPYTKINALQNANICTPLSLGYLCLTVINP